MSSREVAEGFVERLKGVVGENNIRLHSVRSDAHMYDVEVAHGDWEMTVCLDPRGESARLLLDDYVIDGLSPSEVLGFIVALVARRAHVRVSKAPVFGRSVQLDVDLGSSRHVSERRRWGSGLASWEQRLLEPEAGG